MNPFEISDALVDAYLTLSPITATSLGVSGSDHLWDDLSPNGRRALYEVAVKHKALIDKHLDHPDADQRLAAEVLSRFLAGQISEYESGDYLRDLGHAYCSFTVARDIFDIMAHDSEEDWAAIAIRMATLGDALDGWTELLADGVAAGNVVPRLQVESIIDQIEHLAGNESRFLGLVAEARTAGVDTTAGEAAAEKARLACGEAGAWLRSEYLPHAPEADGVGAEIYGRAAERYLGCALDAEETYVWAWSEIARLRAEMTAEAARIDPDLSLPEVLDLLETDPGRAVPRQRFCAFVEERLRQAVVDLDGTHFDVPEPVKPITVNLAPEGGALGAWYINPSIDWERPGSVWYALGTRTQIPVWQEVSTAYHEGFPGHHLQIGIAMEQAERLSRAHRLLIWYSGHGEGWALYAERVMDELGYFETPDFRLGLLASQLFRAVRVVVDIGIHLGFPIPGDAPLHPGAVWDYAIAVDYVEKVGLQVREVAESEVKRYFGWPGQAISYKVGEREILDIRRQLEERGDFDRKDFHRRVLESGNLRLDHLREILLG